MPFCDANGLSLYYEQGGQGERLLFISGTGGDLRSKPSAMDGPMAKSFEVVAYDQRGLGQSDIPAGPYSMADYADDAVGLLDAVGWESCLVIGVSFGGMVAQELAVRYGDRVRRLVLACTSSGGRGGASYPLHELADLDPAARAVRQVEILDSRWDEAWRASHAEQWQQMVDGIASMRSGTAGESEDAARGAALQIEARSHHDTADRLAQITCPTLVCGGKYDAMAPPSNSEFLAESIPGAELAFFEGGHLFLIQDRAAFPAMVGFLKSET